MRTHRRVWSGRVVMVGLVTLLAVVALLGVVAVPRAGAIGFGWADGVGGQFDDYSWSTAVDGSGNVYVTGYFQQTVDFDPGAGTFDLTSAGNYDVFVVKLNAAGGLVWADRMGGPWSDGAQGVAVDGSGNVYVAGYFEGTVDFDPGVGTFDLTSTGGHDVFVAKLNAAGGLVWADHLGGTDYDYGYGVAVDGSGNVYVTGYFEGTADFDPGAGTFDLTSAGIYDVFVVKLDAAGGLVWADRMGSGSEDFGYGVAVDGSGNVYAAGTFFGTVDFDPGPGTSNLTSAGAYDGFVVKLGAGGGLVWADRLGGTSFDDGYGVAVDGLGNVYVTGDFRETADFDPGPGTFNLTSAGSSDAFLVKLGAGGGLVWADRIGGGASDAAWSVAVDGSGNVYATGWFSGTVDFDPGAGTFDLTSAGSSDVFVAKLGAAGGLLWADRMGGVSDDYGYGVAVDGSGNVYAAGTFTGTADFDPGEGTFNLTASGVDGFVVKGTPTVLRSQAVADGWVLEQDESSGKGGMVDSVSTTCRVGDDGSDRQYRTILGFDTSGLPEDAVITGVTLRIKKKSIVGANPFDTHGFLTVDIKTGAFQGDEALERFDFQAAGSRGNVGRFVRTPAEGWYRAPLRAGAWPLVNLTGTTQLRLRFATDDNDDLGADYLSLWCGDAAEADRPQLIVDYYAP